MLETLFSVVLGFVVVGFRIGPVGACVGSADGSDRPSRSKRTKNNAKPAG